MAAQTITRWSPEQLERRRAEHAEVLVLDVRTADARLLQPREIPGARWLPLANVVENAAALPRDGTLVTYCT